MRALFAFWTLHREVNRRYRPKYRKHVLAGDILIYLRSCSGNPTVSDIANHLGLNWMMTIGWIYESLDYLKQRGHVTHYAGLDDKKLRRYSLTLEGVHAAWTVR